MRIDFDNAGVVLEDDAGAIFNAKYFLRLTLTFVMPFRIIRHGFESVG